MFYPLSSGSAVKICAFASKQDLRVTQVSVLKLLPVTALCFKGHLCFTTPRSETSSPSHRPPHNLLSDSSLSLHPETQDSPSTPCFELLFDNCHAEGIVGMASILDQTQATMCHGGSVDSCFPLPVTNTQLVLVTVEVSPPLTLVRGITSCGSSMSLLHQRGPYICSPSDPHPSAPVCKSRSHSIISLKFAWLPIPENAYIQIQWKYLRWCNDSSHVDLDRYVKMQILCSHSCSAVSTRLPRGWLTNCVWVISIYRWIR